MWSKYTDAVALNVFKVNPDTLDLEPLTTIPFGRCVGSFYEVPDRKLLVSSNETELLFIDMELHKIVTRFNMKTETEVQDDYLCFSFEQINDNFLVVGGQ